MTEPVPVNRADFLAVLESVAPGLSRRESVEQSSCLAFRGQEVLTYNDEVACRAPHGIGHDLQFAVKADPVMKLLAKLDEDRVTLQQVENTLVVGGKRKQTKIALEAAVTLAVDSVERPEPDAWKALHPDFSDAIGVVMESAGKDETKFALTCVRLAKKWMETSDAVQCTRYRLRTGVDEPVLVRRDSLKHVLPLDMTEMALTDEWVHFRNPSGLVVSCRKYPDTFPVDLTPLLEMEGEAATLPKDLERTVERADIFSSLTADQNRVTVTLKPGKMKIVGSGDAGEHTEWPKVKYNGPEITFLIAPKLLIALTKRHTECVVSDTRLKVDGGRWVFITSLGAKPKPVEQVSPDSPEDD